MKKQYDEFGLKIILIDESYSKNKNSRNKTLTNFIEDNELNDVVFLVDNKKQHVARKYGVHKLPATFLITKQGRIQHRWEQVTLSSELAMAIEKDLAEKLLVKHFDN